MHLGLLVGCCVWLSSEESKEILYELGYGKGVLSRSKPSFFTLEKEGTAAKFKGSRGAFHAKHVSSVVHHPNGTESEYLQLSAMESFYLQDKVGNISIRVGNAMDGTGSGDILSTEELWKILVSRMGITFTYDYCAYCHYKNMGWIIKGGLKYGVDMVLYSAGGPRRNHAQLAVSINRIYKKEDPCSIKTNRFKKMSDFQALSRVSETVAKGVLIAFVFLRADSEIDLTDPLTLPTSLYHPSVIKEFLLEDYAVRRWDPTKEREDST